MNTQKKARFFPFSLATNEHLQQDADNPITLNAINVVQERLTATAPFKSTLNMGESLQLNEYLTSPSGYFFAIMQGDGHFCVYRGSGPQSSAGYLWGSDNIGPNGSYSAVMQSDGNFCVYNQSGGYLWGIGAHSGGPFTLCMQDDGNLCVYGAGGWVWGSQVTDPVTDCTNITAIKFDVSKATYVSVTPGNVYSTQVSNTTPTPQVSTIGGSYTVTETSGWSNALSLKIGVKTSFKTGLPVVAEGQVEISAEVTDTYTWNGSSSAATAFTFSAAVNVPPNSTMKCNVMVSMSTIALPYALTGTLLYASGATAQGTLQGTYTGTTSGDVNVTYSPVIAKQTALATFVEHQRIVPALDISPACAAA
jgi:hypothetical protein